MGVHDGFDTMNKMNENLQEFLNNRLDISISEDESYFELAFIRKSTWGIDNQRLAFLGDAVLKLIIREYIFKEHPNGDKGILTVMCSRIESNDNFATIAKELGLVKLLDFRNNPPPNPEENIAVNAETLEALFGAIYLHSGFKEAERIARRHILKVPVCQP